MKQTLSERGKNPRYRTYLLTCWQERDEVAGTVTWRFGLETPGDNRRRAFSTLKDGMTWIESELHHETRIDEKGGNPKFKINSESV